MRFSIAKLVTGFAALSGLAEGAPAKVSAGSNGIMPQASSKSTGRATAGFAPTNATATPFERGRKASGIPDIFVPSSPGSTEPVALITYAAPTTSRAATNLSPTRTQAAPSYEGRRNVRRQADPVEKRQAGSSINPTAIVGAIDNPGPFTALGIPGWTWAGDKNNAAAASPPVGNVVTITGSGFGGSTMEAVCPDGTTIEAYLGNSSVLKADCDKKQVLVGGYDAAQGLPPDGNIACVVVGGVTSCAVDSITATSSGSSTATPGSSAASSQGIIYSTETTTTATAPTPTVTEVLVTPTSTPPAVTTTQSAASSATSSAAPNGDHKLGGGQIAGAVVGSLAGAALLALAGCRCYQNRGGGGGGGRRTSTPRRSSRVTYTYR